MRCRISLLIVTIVLACAFPLAAGAATLDLGSASGTAGTTVSIPITLTNSGASIAAVGIDIGYDATLLSSPTAVIGAAGTAAGKSVSTSTPSTGVFRIGVAALNTTAIGDGVVATVSFTISSSAPAGALTLTNTPSASDPSGTDVTITGANGTITVSAAPDTTAPTVTAFAVTTPINSLTVPVTSFTATDSVGVTGYLITESSTAPASSATGWTAAAPSSYTAASSGSKTLYAWAKDAAGNVSASRSATVLIDTTAPTVSAFTMPSTATTLAVAVSSFSATDTGGSGVAGYLITESATAPAASASGWSSSIPTSFTATSGGSKTFYAWAKDAAGNVSAGKSASVTITLSGPTLTVSTLPDGTSTKNPTLNITGTVTAGGSAVSGLTIALNGGTPVPVTFDGSGNFNTAITLTNGANVIVVTATDAGSNTSTNTRTITLDPNLADLTITQPATSSSFTQQNFYNIVGTVGAPQTTSSVTIQVNSDTPATAVLDGANFSLTVSLASGRNDITITATDSVSGTHTELRTITSDSNAPVLAVTSPAQDVTIHEASITLSGTVTDAVTSAVITIAANGVTYTPTVGTDGSFSQVIPLPTYKTYAIDVTATDQAANTATIRRNVIRAYPTGALDGTSIPTIADAIKVLRFSLGLDTPTATQLINCDVGPLDSNKKPLPDGVIDIRDVLLVLERAVGTITW
ncbi:cohesin domain-containing protein [Geobacter sp. FeAm09]|uniref:cohesin domain-containing protein n=1 Tax=Geobacter sp. FeAm09 TaxID=2597769 RepID=UPI00143CDE42|nr:cohesin domain-containing protein [Geobacter sp. FeAm09]